MSISPHPESPSIAPATPGTLSDTVQPHRRSQSEEAEGHLAAIIDSSDDAIISKDFDGIIKTWNLAAQRIFGYTASEVVGASVLMLIPADLQYEEADILAKIRSGQRIDHFETTRIRKNGETFEVSLTISPIRDSAGIAIGTSKIARDISAHKHLERKLIQAEKIATMGRMAATIAHEINNPLESVINLVYLAKIASQSPDVLEYLETAETELNRISHIARQTLGYYRETTVPVPVHSHTLLSEVLRVYQSKIATRSIFVESVFDTLRPVMANKGELTQILSNLIANALDAMPNGGTLRIGISETTPDMARINIQDNGSGIPPQYLAKIFEPFFTTKGELGTGIGLWVARQLMEKHGGQISVVSDTSTGASGTTVSLSLPFAA